MRRRPRWLPGLLLIILSCSHSGGQLDAESVPAARERRPGEIAVHLHFGGEADLDLFVTDPDAETVYFGNTPSRGGGRLEADLRCDAPLPRTETVRFLRPQPGRYRVGVEYSRACRFRRVAAPFRIELRGDSLQIDRDGVIEPGRFEPIVLEFEHSAAGLDADRAPHGPARSDR